MNTLIKIFFIFVVFSANAFSQDAIDAKFMKRINGHRSALGLNQLKWDPTLDSIADVWVRQMIESFDAYTDDEIEKKYDDDMFFIHINFKERVKSVRNGNQVAFKGRFISEIAILTIDSPFQDIPNDSFKEWAKSKPHYREMTSVDGDAFGFAYFEDMKSGRSLYVCVFSGTSKP